MSSPFTRSVHAFSWRRLRVADPGRARLRLATNLTISIAVAVIVAWSVAKATDQFTMHVTLPDGSPFEIVHHGSAMMLAAAMALMISMLPLPPVRKIRGGLSVVLTVVFFLGTMLAMTFNGSITSSMIGLCATAVVFVLLGQKRELMMLGLPLFFGTFMNVFLGLDTSNIGGIALVVFPAGIAVAITQALLCPRPTSIVRSVFKGFDTATDKVIHATTDMLTGRPGSSKARRNLAVAGRRMEMMALNVDAQLGSPIHGLSAELVDSVHVNVFDREAALSSIASAALAYDAARATAGDTVLVDTVQGNAVQVNTAQLNTVQVDPDLIAGLRALLDDDTANAQHHAARAIDAADQRVTADPASAVFAAEYRLAIAVGHAVVGWRDVDALIAQGTTDGDRTFAASVVVGGTGELPGITSATEAMQADTGTLLGFSRPVMERAIRMGVAVSIASVLASWYSEPRWYYGFFGAFAVFMSANGTREHIRVSLERGVGTAVGCGLGLLIATSFIGHLEVAYVVLFALIWIAFYFQRASDLLNNVAMGVMVALLYVQMQTYDDVLITDRIVTTLIGSAVAIVVSLVVFRVPTTKITRSAAKHYFVELEQFVDSAFGNLTATDADRTLRARARKVHAAQWQLGQTIAPIAPFGSAATSGPTTEHYSVITAIGTDAARIASDAALSHTFTADQQARLETVRDRLIGVLPAVGDWLANDAPAPPIERSGELVELDREVRAAGGTGADAKLAVLTHLMGLEEHLIDLLNVDLASSPDDLAVGLVR